VKKKEKREAEIKQTRTENDIKTNYKLIKGRNAKDEGKQ
jgi:hypothetical protein